MENENKKRQTPIYLTVNKNGFVSIWNDEPKRDESTGKWKGNFPFCNSDLYKELVQLSKESNLNWENEAVRFDIMLN